MLCVDILPQTQKLNNDIIRFFLLAICMESNEDVLKKTAEKSENIISLLSIDVFRKILII